MTDERGDGDVPLDIAGHEERSRPSDEADADPFGESEERSNGDSPVTGTAADDAAPPSDPIPDVPVDGDGENRGDEPVELLVQLAEDGEIDPWDIDVVAVTERFLDALEEGDLRNSGRALFYASVLVRMKSDVLLEPDDPGDEEPEPWEVPMDAEEPEESPPGFDPVEGLEAEMERRLQRKSVRGKPETLDELVRELRDAERNSWWKESREYDTSDSPAGFDRGTQTVDYHGEDGVRAAGEPTEEEALERTHGEDIEEIIDDVRATLREHYEAGRPEVLFRELEGAGGSRVMSYLALLFLANRGEVRLQQDELFGDLWVQDPNADLGTEGAVAD